MKLNELISKAEEKKASAYEKYQKAETLTTGAMAFYMDITNAFLELIEALKKLDLPVVSGRSEQLEEKRKDFCLWYYSQSQPLDANEIVEWFASKMLELAATSDIINKNDVIADIKLRLSSDLERFDKETEKPCFYTKSDKIKRVKLLLDSLENLEHYLIENV
jgi:hypothetical protein